MRKLTTVAILTVFLSITFTLLGFVFTPGSAAAATSDMRYEEYWFDLETGTIFLWDIWDDPPNNDCDFKFAYNSNTVPHACIVQNGITGVEIAFSEEDYADVEFTDVAALSFTTDVVPTPFSQVAVLHTPEGNYFKVGLVSEDPSGSFARFQWDQLVPITIEKSGTLDPGTDGIANPGDVINYTFTVTNTGNANLANLMVTDPKVTNIVPAGPIILLIPGESITFTGSYALTQADIDAASVVNTATATCTSADTGAAVTGTSSETVDVPPVVGGEVYPINKVSLIAPLLSRIPATIKGWFDSALEFIKP